MVLCFVGHEPRRVVKDLLLTDLLLTFEGRPTSITGLKKIKSQETVYNFEVKENHNYFVSSAKILVHNKKIPFQKIMKAKTMANTEEIMKDFEKCLSLYNKSSYEKFQRGLSYDEVNEPLKKIGITDSSVLQLYQWRNGIRYDTTEIIGQFDFFSRGKMLPLNEAIEHYKICLEDSLWRDNYFPLFTTHAGDYLLYDFDKTSKTWGKLLLYSPSLLVVKPETAYDSLDSLFKTVIACYEKGIYKLNNSENTLDIDYEMEFKLTHEKNPESEYWKE